MKVYVAMPAESMDFDEILVADSLDGIKNKCEKYCREVIYDELVNVQTEVSCNNGNVFVHITGEDPEEVYAYSYDYMLDEIVGFLVRERETE